MRLAERHRHLLLAHDQRHDVHFVLRDGKSLMSQRAAQRAGVRAQPLKTRSAFVADLSAASAPATAGGGGAVEKISGRAVLIR